ncbi:hypothetical protein PF005_g16073 [Phytophthora fragariae]|uniref:Uncharacterized protein n=1 Tax=Phytophthora fragariae TaxID=53985 RepID=A0A6A3XA69_9STRA|nr:hypothetical protein PF005_g16073 [Phytophthora fragariae]
MNKKELEMAARRETRSEHDAYLSRLAGRCLEDRQRLSADHRAYLDGTRYVDAGFGPAEQAPRTETPTVAVTPAVAATPATPRARAAPPLPPRGKDACYLVNAKKLRASRLAEEAAKTKGAPGKKKMSKRQAAEIQREKRLMEARAVARATTAAAARASKKKAERARVAAVEQRGSEGRRAALSQLQQKD